MRFPLPGRRAPVGPSEGSSGGRPGRRRRPPEAVDYMSPDRYVAALGQALGVGVYDGVEAARAAGLLPDERR